MNVVESIELSKVLRCVSKPKYVLGTTYTLSLAFFESVVFPFIDRSNLKSCLILCDMLGYQRALTEGAALQGAAQDYMVVPAPVSGSFHPKVWLIVGDEEVVLLSGSGNLTQAGFMTNAEFFDTLSFSTEKPPSRELLHSIRSFITGLADMWQPEDSQHLLCVDVLRQMDVALQGFPVTTAVNESTTRFIHSFRGTLMEQLPVIPNAREIHIAAPFFGGSLKGLHLFAERYPTAKVKLFPAVHDGKATDIPPKQVTKTYKGASVSQLSVVSKKRAFAHLKLYGVAGEKDTAWLCCTSANCTEAAWQGANVEAGILRAVPHPLLADYFVPDKAALPEAGLEHDRKDALTNAFHCWGTDTGQGLDLVVATSCRRLLPFRDVTLTIRAGSNMAACRRPVLFENGVFAHIAWTAFDCWERRRRVAICLDIEGRATDGKRVRGSCLVENRLLLSADPIHRSAWRGAMALLDAEGAPELADIAALFTLAKNLFDGTLVRVPKVVSGAAERPTDQEDEKVSTSIAVWPPQPDIRELQKKIGATAVGQLQWFQRILQTLLHCETSGSTTRSPDSASLNKGDDEEDNAEAETRLAEEEKRARSVAERVWEHARQNYERLANKLIELCPTPDKAPNIWPAAIFAFLSTIAVLRAAQRMASDLDFGTSAEELCDDFLRLMLHERRQDEDYCRPKGFRYPGEKFPPLADDLRATFNVRLDRALTIVMLALIVDKKTRCQGGVVPYNWPRYVEQVCDKDFVPDSDARDECRLLWRRYVCSAATKATDADFDNSFAAFCNMKFTGAVS